MATMLIHITDMHITDDSFYHKADLIVKAALSNINDISAICLVISGDISNSGSVEEFDFSKKLIHQLEAAIYEKTSICPYLLICSGNHDCNFREDQSVRDSLLAVFRQNPRNLTDKITEQLSSVLGNYKKFQQDVAPHIENMSPWLDRFTIPSEKIIFLLLNSAVASTKKEEQGKLYVPLAKLPEVDEGYRVVLVMHHPFNWLMSDNARDLSQYASATGDIFLLGHEHVLWAQTVSELYSNNSITYIKGHVMRDPHDPANSGFQTIVIDGENGFLVQSFKWSVNAYHRDEASSTQFRSWPSVAKKHGVGLSSEGYAKLTSTGTNFSHRRKSSLSLRDIFVWPDLKRITSRRENSGEPDRLSAEEIVQDYQDLTSVVVVRGGEQFGKSSLAKMVAFSLIGKGVFPLLLMASEVSSWRDRSLNDRIDSNIDLFYGAGFRDIYRQLDSEKKCLVIDDFDLLQVTKGYFDGLKALRQHFGKIILLLDSYPGLEMALSEFLQDENFLDSTIFELLPSSYHHRLQLIEKWLLIDDAGISNQEATKVIAAKMSKVVDETLGRNLVPSIPLFVLIILQRAETEHDIDTVVRSGSHGFLYESLITQALTKNVTVCNLVTIYAYLTSFAGLIFTEECEQLTQLDFARFHVAHCDEYDLEGSVQKFQNQLSSAGILEVSEDRVCFKYPYHYYYFVARYLTNEAWTSLEPTVDNLVASLHTEKSANILLFLAHLGKNPNITQKVLSHAKSCLSDFEEADLFHQKDVLSKYALSEIRQVLLDGSRSEQLSSHENDSVLTERASAEFSRASNNRLKAKLNDVLAMNTAFKALQVLGQLLRNHAGDTKRQAKRELTDACISLGLRVLQFVLTAAKDNSRSMIEFRALQIKNEQPRIDRMDLEDELGDYLPHLVGSMAVGTLIKIANAVGSEEISRTLNVVLSTTPTRRLIALVSRLEHFSDFPSAELLNFKEAELMDDSHVLPYSVLRRFIIRRFYLFPSRDELKKSMCAQFKISTKAFAALPQSPLEKKARSSGAKARD